MEIQSIHQNMYWDPSTNGQGNPNGHYTSDEEEFESGNSSAKLFERSRIRALAIEREAVQKKTFTKWVNSHLSKANCQIEDLYMDLRDGRMLLKLLEILSGEKLPKATRGKMRIHCLENVDKSLNFLNEQHVHLENMGAHDIVDGNERLTLGLIWTIILRFQIQDIMVEEYDTSDRRSAKDALLLWCQMKTAGYNNVNIRNFTTSWKDGLAFNALIHKHCPELIDYAKLTKATPIENLENAFQVAKENLEIDPLLDAEDLCIEQPDEKSVMTYVVTYYHCFNKMKSDTVHSKRIGKVVNQAIESQQLINQYEDLTSDLLEWIHETVKVLNDREFDNSLAGVQQQLASFNTYRTIEKPPKFTEKGNLEILLFTVQSKMRSNNQKPYNPSDGRLLSDINRAWEVLEKAEHSRELALREELIRQEKLEQLAARFDRKAGMREAWLSENQRLVAQDNFGSDLAAVEAATKKHEAIETDIFSYEERVNAVVNVAQELENEQYHDIGRVMDRKENVMQLWHALLELLKARRHRLDLSRQLQNVFQEMQYLIDWIEEIKTRLSSEDYGKHLMGVEDLLQKHSLLEADIRVLGSRMNQVLDQAQPFIDGTTSDEVGDYKPCDSAVVSEHGEKLRNAYNELMDLAEKRQKSLEESRQMWQFFWEMSDEQEWIKEKSQLMSSPDLGHDLSSVERLLRKHKAIEEELHSRQTVLNQRMGGGEDLICAKNMGAPHIRNRIDDMKQLWEALIDLTTDRKQRLIESQEFFQLMSECDDVDSWMSEMLRLVSNEDVGNKLATTESFIKKNQEVLDNLELQKVTINQLHEQAAKVADYPDSDSATINSRLDGTNTRYAELREMALHRQQRLLDALSMYKLFNVSDTVRTWITEKEKLLATMVPGDEIEELEVIRHRFGGFELELANNAEKVGHVNKLSENLLGSEHPSSKQILLRQDELNSSWNDLADVVDKHRQKINAAYEHNQYLIECTETANWIREKAKLIESTDELGNDLDGIMQLQRKLGGLQRDLKAIEAKVEHLDNQAVVISDRKPESREVVFVKRDEIDELWANLKEMLKERDDRLNDSSELQRFLQDLDHFQMWLSRTSTTVASEDIPKDLQEAEKLTAEHHQLKEEIYGYEADFKRLMEFGRKVTEGQVDAQYLFLSQRLNALEEGWEALHKMCDDREILLRQSTSMQIFLRDAIQVDIILSQQENFLSKEDVPTTVLGIQKQNSLEAVQLATKQNDNFMMSMNTNDEKINNVLQYGQQLVDEGNFASEKIKAKCDIIQERCQNNRLRAANRMGSLQENILLQENLQEIDDLEEWIAEKMLVATDDSYRDAKNISARYSKFKAFEEEIAANKYKVEKVITNGEELIQEHPSLKESVEPRIVELQRQWDELNATASAKSASMAEANRELLFDETAKSMMSWMADVSSQIVTTTEVVTEEIGLVEITQQMKDQDRKDTELEQKRKMLDDLDGHAVKLKEQYPERHEEFEMMQQEVRIKLTELEAPLANRRDKLGQHKRVRQFLQDVDDERSWVAEKMAIVESSKMGTSLLAVQQMLRRHKMLTNEVENHRPRIVALCEEGAKMISEDHPQRSQFRQAIDDLWDQFERLEKALTSRQTLLEKNEVAQQYLFDADEAEAWMGEQELYLMGEESAKQDEQAANNAIKKHEQLEKTIENYADEIRSLGERSRTLIEAGHPESDAVAIKQSRVDRMYAGLNELSVEKKQRLEEIMKLYHLLREILDLETWIQERTIVASSHEMGADYEHCCILRDRFAEFARETNEVGRHRVIGANEMCDALIEQGHAESPEIAEWKDRINEMWADLLELIETRIQLLKAAWDLHKFLCDCTDVLDRIMEKSSSIPEEVGRDAKAVTALLRKHTAFEYEMGRLGQQVEGIVEAANHLLPSYAASHERLICDRRDEVVNAWRQLQRASEQRKISLLDATDLHRFFSMVRELMHWMDTMSASMNAREKPRDVSGVDLLMNSHRTVKAEIDAREENLSICVSLGRTLLQRRHPRQEEVREKCIALVTQRVQLGDQWSDRWEDLQLMLEVYQFARDAAVAESWLGVQEPYLSNQELGESLDETLALLKKHISFEKAVATQEERFVALERLTTFELKERERTPETILARQHARQRRIEDAIREFQPPPPPPPEPVTVPKSLIEEKKTSQVMAEPGWSGASGGASGGPVAKGIDETDQPHHVKAVTPQAMEGMLVRKHEWENKNKKAFGRSWHELYMVFVPTTDGGTLSAYKDQRHYRERSHDLYHHEAPVIVTGGFAAPATDYAKRPHVFRLKLANGGEFLFQTHGPEEMKSWVAALNSISSGGSTSSRSATLPHSSQQPETSGSAKKKFFTLGRKK